MFIILLCFLFTSLSSPLFSLHFSYPFISSSNPFTLLPLHFPFLPLLHTSSLFSPLHPFLLHHPFISLPPHPSMSSPHPPFTPSDRTIDGVVPGATEEGRDGERETTGRGQRGCGGTDDGGQRWGAAQSLPHSHWKPLPQLRPLWRVSTVWGCGSVWGVH